MANHPDLPSVPQATVVQPRRARISVVWVIPILAAVVAVGIAVQRILNEGPTITIVFTVALVQLQPLMSVMPGPGVLFFAAVVVLTMIAAETFDPRLIWDPTVTGGSVHA